MQHGAGARLLPSARSALAKAQLSCEVQATKVGSLGGDQEDFLEEVPLQAEDLEQSEGGQGTNIGGNGGPACFTCRCTAKEKKHPKQDGQALNTPFVGQCPWSCRVV